MNRDEAQRQKFQAQLDEWKAQIDQLKAKAEQAQADAKLAYQDEVDRLTHMQADAQQKLDALKQPGSQAWEDLTQGADEALTSLKQAIQKARARFD
ncbi:coiled coil domain-containing protein [Thiomicrospira sp. WB1]|uniref:coiled coil domain-containing protein n=1 Tax=Thiomicrospira sp. WB1 TaxID=1685380 RepID=UPI00074AA4C8|nr:coiled coil domain-containing protein [Thiomicrospira sp. WB1]KUJ72549.1 hypothetical protein AVO41_01705 [Thiomicrospira sp. WB1]